MWMWEGRCAKSDDRVLLEDITKAMEADGDLPRGHGAGGFHRQQAYDADVSIDSLCSGGR
jgi:hypothetical protein